MQSVSRRTNPVHDTRASAGLTLEKASEQAGVHVQFFFLQEQGVYGSISPAICEWLVWHEVNIPEAQRGYRDFQRSKRKSAGEQFGVAILELGPPEGNPIIGLRGQLRLTRMGFAKRFCLHPGLLYRVENGITRSLPSQLREALAEAGFTTNVLDEIAFRMKEMYG